MNLSLEQIKTFISQPSAGEDIAKGDQIQNEHKVHITGEGYEDVLASVIGETRTLEYGNRELKEPITKFLTKKVKDELSRWKNTTGTRKTYDFGDSVDLEKKFRELLSGVWKGGSITDFAYWLNDALYTDFNGFAIVERGAVNGREEIRDGIPYKSEGGKPYIIFKALKDIYDFRLTGRKVEYLIIDYGTEIRTIEEKKETVKLYRVIDDRFDYIFSQSSLGILEEAKKRIPNPLGFVPAIQISDILANPLNDNIKTSHIYQTLPLLQDYMTRHAEHVICELIHASPILALMGQKCTHKEGEQQCTNGEIFIEGNWINCPKCDGKGATVPSNSSEVIIVPQTDKNGDTFDPKNIGQYITPPTEVLAHQSKELDELEQRVIYSGTGIKAMVKTSIQTATEIVLNLKPLEDKISTILDNIEAVEDFVTYAIGKMWNPAEFKGSQAHYGRKLNIRDENLILNEIEQSKRAGMPVSQIRLLLQELVVTRYQNSKEDMERAIMLLYLEPAAVFSPEEVQESLFYSTEEKTYKMNFDDYIDRFELEHGPISLYKASMDLNNRLKSIKKILEDYNEKSVARNEKGQVGREEDQGILRPRLEEDKKLKAARL